MKTFIFSLLQEHWIVNGLLAWKTSFYNTIAATFPDKQKRGLAKAVFHFSVRKFLLYTFDISPLIFDRDFFYKWFLYHCLYFLKIKMFKPKSKTFIINRGVYHLKIFAMVGAVMNEETRKKEKQHSFYTLSKYQGFLWKLCVISAGKLYSE